MLNFFWQRMIRQHKLDMSGGGGRGGEFFLSLSLSSLFFSYENEKKTKKKHFFCLQQIYFSLIKETKK
jgi:hypothetical protein